MNIELQNIIKPLLAPDQILLEITEDLRGNYIRIIIDSEYGLTLDDTAKLTKTLKRTEKLDSLFPEGFRLEVSTPGIDSPLMEPFQYKKNLNRNLNVVYLEGGSEFKTTSKIVSANDNSFELKKDDKTFFLSYSQVKSAKVKVSFK
tara:strand:- start:49 stop:486 length:438 start_codon:yes stop_codon:yes gene_type:complete